jgi:hypothetical protein
MSANKPLVEFSLTQLCQSRRASSSFVKICFCCCCCRHNLLKCVNDFPTRTVHISWQICAKFRTRELYITLSGCEFPANQAVKDRLYLGWWYEFPHSFYIFIRFRQKNTAHVMSTKIYYVTVRFVKTGAGYICMYVCMCIIYICIIYIYISLT